MKSAIISIGYACALALIGSAAAAEQPRTSSSLKSLSPAGSVGVGSDDVDGGPSALAIAMGRQVSNCMVLRHPAMVARYISADADAASGGIKGPAFNGLDDALTGCMVEISGRTNSIQMNLGQRMLQGLFAEASLRMLSRDGVDLPVDSAPNYAASWVSAVPALSVVDRMALCLAAGHPAESMALVRSDPGTPGEATAMTAIMPHIHGCLIQNATLKADRTAVRLAVAKAVYHRRASFSAMGFGS